MGQMPQLSLFFFADAAVRGMEQRDMLLESNGESAKTSPVDFQLRVGRRRVHPGL
jgi:hypothetical protein